MKHGKEDEHLMNDVIDEHHTPKRAGDFSVLTRIGSFFLKFNWLFALLVGLFVAAGFGWKTPQSKFQELSNEIRANRIITQEALDTLKVRADKADVNSERLVDILDLFSIDLCLRRKDDLYVYRRLSCRELLTQPGGP